MTLKAGLLPNLPRASIEAAYAAAPGNELQSGKFESPESSSALVANAFGWFLERPGDLPCFIDTLGEAWQVRSIGLEVEMRFPWSGGKHPWLDASVSLSDHLIGIESKRYEPFRSRKTPSISNAYFRDVWGEAMSGYGRVLRALSAGKLVYQSLDAAQLVKHAYGLRTELQRSNQDLDTPTEGWLVYLYAEPSTWPNGKPVDPRRIKQHREEIMDFEGRVAGDEITFLSISWQDILAGWRVDGKLGVSRHAKAVSQAFSI